MTEFKREHIKYIRDFIKKDYKKKNSCFICGSNEKLELHHLYSLSQLWHDWCILYKVPEVTTVDKLKELRIPFSKDLEIELSNDNLYTLCKVHHLKLHTIYGQRYHNGLTPKILNWLKRMKEKHELAG